jgi:hypothetical protein
MMLDQRLRDATRGVKETLADISPPDLDLTDLELRPAVDRRIRPVWKRVLVAVGTFVSILLVFGVLPLLLSANSSTPGTSRDVYRGGEESVVPLGFEPGLTRSGDTLWTWDRDGHVSAYVDGSWIGIPSLSDPVVDVAGPSPSAAWAITTSRCDPTSTDWEGVGCETTLSRLVDDAWQPLPQLGDLQLPDDLEDLEFDSTGILWIVTADGALYTWDGTEATTVVDAGVLHNDGVAITGDGIVWASRFNFYFAEDVGFARLDVDGSTWEAVSPLDGVNHHSMITTTPDGDLWVWFSEFPSTASLSGRALAFYDSQVGAWTIYESNIPKDTPRAMAASSHSVWLAMDSNDAGLWRFDGDVWTLPTTSTGAEILDVATAPDGTVWYVEDNALHQVEP